MPLHPEFPPLQQTARNVRLQRRRLTTTTVARPTAPEKKRCYCCVHGEHSSKGCHSADTAGIICGMVIGSRRRRGAGTRYCTTSEIEGRQTRVALEGLRQRLQASLAYYIFIPFPAFDSFD